MSDNQIEAAGMDISQDEIVPAEGLTFVQRIALGSLVSGQTVSEAAKSAGITRKAVHQWLKRDLVFREAFQQWTSHMEEAGRARLLTLTEKATVAVERALEAGDAKLGMQLLKGLGVLRASKEKNDESHEVVASSETAL